MSLYDRASPQKYNSKTCLENAAKVTQEKLNDFLFNQY